MTPTLSDFKIGEPARLSDTVIAPAILRRAAALSRGRLRLRRQAPCGKTGFLSVEEA
jgi:hypothetical protein